MSTTPESEITEEIQSEREQALAELTDVIDQCRYKTLGDGRIRSPEKERVRLKYLRVIVQAIGERRKLLKDAQLDELEAELEELKEQTQP